MELARLSRALVNAASDAEAMAAACAEIGADALAFTGLVAAMIGRSFGEA